MNIQAITNRMNELGLNHRTLALKAGVSVKMLQNVFEGRDVLGFFDTMKVARFLGLKLETLLADKTDATKNLRELIVGYCKVRDWNIPDFAESAELNANSLLDVISGVGRLGNTEAARIARQLGISVDELASVCLGDMSVTDALEKGAGDEA